MKKSNGRTSIVSVLRFPACTGLHVATTADVCDAAAGESVQSAWAAVIALPRGTDLRVKGSTNRQAPASEINWLSNACESRVRRFNSTRHLKSLSHRSSV